MIPFPFNENRFSLFFAADNLLVGQLSINPKSDRSLLSCLKETQCSTSEIGDAPLYNSCSQTDPSYDSQKHHWIATNNRDMLRVMKTKFPATVMVFGVVSSEGHIMPPRIFEVGLKIITKIITKMYLDVLKSVVIPWCSQDSAPTHKSKETQAWLQKEYYDFVPFSHWPPSSPDLNALDYLVWSYVENITSVTSHNTKASLIAAISRVFAELPLALVEKACSQFCIRIDPEIEAEGSYIE